MENKIGAPPFSISTLFFLLISHMLFVPITCIIRNHIDIGQSLSVEDDSDIITSPDSSFECGFYGLAGTNAYYFAVWFSNSRNKTVVWTANRDKPVNGKGSELLLNSNGVMHITDVDGTPVWKTNNTSTDAERAELLDTGNLVLKDPKGNILWQSFDYPTDTLLPSQSFTKQKKLISSLRTGSFESGYFSMYFDSDNVLRLIHDGPEISSIYWPNLNFNLFENGRTNYNSSRFAYFDDAGMFRSSDRLRFNASDLGTPGVKRRLTLDYDGNLRLYSLNNLTGSWDVTWVALARQCDVHGMCARNGICVYMPEPKCSCPPGYEVNDPSDWNKGCRPTFNMTCSTSHSQQMKFAKIPHSDFYGFDRNYSRRISFAACRNICLGDCRCKAFSYRFTGTGLCFTKNDLFNGLQYSSFPGIMYIKLPMSMAVSETTVLVGSNPKCRGNETILVGSPSIYAITGKRVRWAYLYSFAVVAGVIELLFFVLGWWFLLRKHGVPVKVEDGYQMLSSQFRKFTHSQLKKATKNFKEELGRGGSGEVFKGILEDERVVAVKRLGNVFQGEAEFWAEVSTIRRINHKNLVRMWGFCAEKKKRLLVYEFVENLSLDKHLFSVSNILGWKDRFNIALGTAKGLAYLHHECLEWVIHCDVKPENILLDGELEPKIADFGLAKLSKRDNPCAETSRIRGTKGYMAPEWALNLPITAKVDVYGYGVVILEIVRGSRLSNWVVDDVKVVDTELTKLIRILKAKIEGREEEDYSWVEDMVDPRLEGQFNLKQAATIVAIGLTCMEEDRSKRPSMGEVVQLLLDCQEF